MEAGASHVAQAHSAEKAHWPHTPANPDRMGRVIEGLQDGSDGSSQWKCQDEGTDRDEQGEKKRKKRAKNWSDDETGMLLKAVPVMRKATSRFCKSKDSERYLWEGVAKEVPGRDAEECRRRMETLKKSYSAIKKYCDNKKKEFGELTKQEVVAMNLATQLSESWYNSIRDHCPPRFRKEMTKPGAGRSASTSGARSRPSADPHNPGAESTKVLKTAAEHVTETKTPSEAFGVVSSDEDGRSGEDEDGEEWGIFFGIQARVPDMQGWIRALHRQLVPFKSARIGCVFFLKKISLYDIISRVASGRPRGTWWFLMAPGFFSTDTTVSGPDWGRGPDADS